MAVEELVRDQGVAAVAASTGVVTVSEKAAGSSLFSRQAMRGFWASSEQRVLPWVGLAGLLLVWQLALDFELVDKFFLASPRAVLEQGVRLFATGEIWPHLRVSAQELALGFGLSVALGIPVGVAMARVKVLRSLFWNTIMGLYAVPSLALLPLIIIWFGIGIGSKVFLIFLGCVFIVLINTEAGVANVDPRLIETARSFTASGRKILTSVILPSALPFIVAGLRLATGRAIIMMVVAELYASTQGIGFLIVRAGTSYDTATVLAGVVILATAGMLLNGLWGMLERRMAPWSEAES